VELLKKNMLPDDKKDILIIEYNEMKKMESISTLFNNIERQTNEISAKMNECINMINSFLSDNNFEKKKIEIESDGTIKFSSEYSNKLLDISFMSSGEKQILTFFTYLAFKINDEDGVFIVDEPELSLHLAWQKRFVNAIRKLKPNIQIIFATHSPDIIGNLYQNMIELKKNIEIDLIQE
jgi:predicted ATP-binding protein involved in virulence